MTVYLKSNKDEIASYFKYPCEVIRTRGTQEGMILKFATFYLKIYDDNVENLYIIEGYRYDSSGIIFQDKVPATQMREYASRF